MKKAMSISLFLIVFISCGEKCEDVRGVYINDSGNKIAIDCFYRFTSLKPISRFINPEQGAEVSLQAMSVGASEYTLTYSDDGMTTPFAKWDEKEDVITVGDVVYERKDCEHCSE